MSQVKKDFVLWSLLLGKGGAGSSAFGILTSNRCNDQYSEVQFASLVDSIGIMINGKLLN
jgi:hypothetical protein